MFKKLILSLACAGALATGSAQADTYVPIIGVIKDSESLALIANAHTNFVLGFLANFISANNKFQKTVGNAAGLGLAGILSSTGLVKNTIANMIDQHAEINIKSGWDYRSGDTFRYDANKRDAMLLRSSNIENKVALVIAGLASYGAGALAGTATRAAIDGAWYALKGTYNLITGKDSTETKDQ